MKRYNPSRALAGVVDWGIFIVASIMLYAKTSEVFARFAPDSFLGFTDVQDLYGMTCALLVEGVLVLGKLSMKYSENNNVLLWNIFLIGTTWTISAAFQIFDGFLTAGTLAQQPVTMRYAVTYGIPLIPSLILAAILVKSIVAAVPEEAVKAAGKRQDKRQNNSPQFTAPRSAGGELQEGNRGRLPGVPVRRNELTAADKDDIARWNTRKIAASFSVEPRTARDWKAAAKRGEL